jgi:hypothetical protein
MPGECQLTAEILVLANMEKTMGKIEYNLVDIEKIKHYG